MQRTPLWALQDEVVLSLQLQGRNKQLRSLGPIRCKVQTIPGTWQKYPTGGSPENNNNKISCVVCLETQEKQKPRACASYNCHPHVPKS